jgi:WD40 repeat protein
MPLARVAGAGAQDLSETPVIPSFQSALTDNSLGIFLADLRGWVFRSPARAATYFGWSRSTIWRYEEGRTLPPPTYPAVLTYLVAQRLKQLPNYDQTYEERLLHELNQAILAYYPDTPTFAEWADVEQLALTYRPAQPAISRDSVQRSTPTPSDASLNQPTTTACIDWGEAPEISAFYGRDHDLAELQQLVGSKQCRLISVVGMGGMGKTVLTTRLVETSTAQFDVICWRSLVNAPPVGRLLREVLQLFGGSEHKLLADSERLQPHDLLPALQQRHCLLVLDNFESILEENRFRPGYEAYGQLLSLFGQARHQSCLILTSREKPQELTGLEQAPNSAERVHSFNVGGLDAAGALAIFRDAGLDPGDPALAELARRCSGNPKILEIVAAAVRDFFSGSVQAFLHQETIIFDDVRTIMRQQFERLSASEREIMYWLALAREPISLGDLQERLLSLDTRRHLLETVRSLQRRSLIETDRTTITLQNAVAEYVIDVLLDRIDHEIRQGVPDLLHRHSLIRATAQDYVRAGQVRVVLQPIAERLTRSYSRSALEQRIAQLRDYLHTHYRDRPSYAGGNLLNLLIQLGIDPTKQSFAHLALWQAALMNTNLHQVDMSHADLRGSVFSETFGSVRSVAFSPDGQLLAAGSSNGEIHVWDQNSRQHRHTIDGQAWIEAVAFSPDSRLLVSASADPIIQVWDSASGNLVGQLEGHTASLRTLAFNPDGTLLASAGDDKLLRLWDMRRYALQVVLTGHDGTIWSVAFHPAGTIVAGAGHGIHLWDVASGRVLAHLDQHRDAVASIAFSPDGTTLASASYDQTIKLWSIPDRQCRMTIQGHTGDVRAVAFRPDGTLLVSAGEDQSIRLWDPASGKARGVIYEQANRVRALAFSPDGNLLASASHDQNVRLWQIDNRQCLTLFQGYVNQLRSMAVAPDGNSMALGVAEQIYLVDAQTGAVRQHLRGHSEWVQSLSFSPDGSRLASASDDHSLRIWHLDGNHPPLVLRGHQSWVQAVAFSPDGQTLASCSVDRTIRLWNPHDGTCRQILEGHTHYIWALAISPDGRWLASGSADETIRLWDLATGTCRRLLTGHTGPVWSLAFTPDSTRLVSGGQDRSLKLWGVPQGQLEQTLANHTSRVVSVAVSPDGHLIASGGDDRSVRIWDRRSGALRMIGQGHRRAVVVVRFSPDGRTVYSGGEDGAVGVWDVANGTRIRTLAAPRPYDGMRISGATGLSPAQRASLVALGAVDE